MNDAVKVKLKDIAQRAGVSSAVVSSVLNRRSGTIRVGTEKREAILSIARELNYTPDISARALAGMPTGTIGILIDSQAPNSDYRLIRALEAEASRCGKTVLVGKTHDNVSQLFKAYRHLQQNHVDAVICVSHDYPGYNDEIERLFANAPKTVFVNGPCIPGCPCVLTELWAGYHEAIRHLHSRGRKRILMQVGADVVISPWFVNRAVVQSFLQEYPEYKENLIPIPTIGVPPETLRKRFHEMIAEVVVPRRIDAFIASNDQNALVMMSELQAIGLKVPDDVAVVGCDNDSFAPLLQPTLSSIDQNEAETAYNTFAIVQDLLAGREPRPCPPVKSKFVPRDSS